VRFSSRVMKRRMFILAAVLAIGVCTATIVFNGHARKAQAATSRVVVSRDGTLQRVSAAQLMNAAGISLAPTTAAPTISVAQAEQIATGVFSDPLLSVSLADCSIAGVDHGACYAVSLQPPAGSQQICSPVTGACESIPGNTFEVVLVNATDGSILTSVASNLLSNGSGPLSP
jgi:hypothetical protein